jgi:dihydroorotase
MTRTRIRGAKVVLPDGIEQVDVIIDGTTIAHVDPPEGAACDEIIDATGLHLMPGVVDDQVHFREPGLTHKEDLYTASRACAAGGVTSYLEMPNTIPHATSQAHIEEKLALAAKKSVVNYGFYIGATGDNVTELAKAHRVPGIKIFVGSSTGDLLVDAQEDLERIFAETTLPIATHAEDESTVRANRERIGTPKSVHDHSKIRDHRAAEICVRRLVELSERHDHPLHILHVSTANEVEILAETGPLVTAEACPHHLFLNIDDYDELGTLAQMNPSLKTKEDNEALWQALRDGVIEVVATDHAPHLLEEKAKPYPESPSGMPGVQTLLPLMLDAAANGRCTLEQLADWMADAPARVWNMVNKGRIEEGYGADLVLVDLEKRKTVRNEEQLSKCGWSAFDGRELQGWPVRTFVMGQEVFGDDKVTTEPLGHEIQYKQDQ